MCTMESVPQIIGGGVLVEILMLSNIIAVLVNIAVDFFVHFGY